MNEFFESLARAFSRNRNALPPFEIALLLVVVLALAIGGARVLRRRRARSSLAQDWARQHGFSEDDLRLARRLARRASTELLRFLTHLEIFERVTAEALLQARSTGRSGDGLPGDIRRVRHLLGFDAPPPHRPLLTTRELAPGTAIEVGSHAGRIAEVDEGAFCVTVGGSVALSPDAPVTLTLAHGREARYALRCILRSAREEPPGHWQLVLAHDETPERIQKREYVRIPIKGSILLRPVVSNLLPSEPGGALYAALVDVSGGGARVVSGTELTVGQTLRASFAVGEVHFAGVRAEVLSCWQAVEDRFHAQLEFRGLAEPERDRLVSAVARLELALKA